MSGNGRQRRVGLSDQQEAIRDYLDALLQDIPDDDDADTEARAPEAVATAAPAEPEPRVDEPEPPAEAAVPDVAAPEPAPESRQEPAADADAVADDTDLPDPMPVAQEAASESAPGSIQALFFHVGGLQLAVRLTDLHSVVPWHEITVTPMPGQPEWHRGIMRHRGRNVHVIDTATMVLPPGHQDSEDACRPPEHVLIVGDGGWGLACHDIGDVVRLGPEDVKWRRAGGRRPWLAGTAINHLCAIMDPGAFTGMLSRERAAVSGQG